MVKALPEFCQSRNCCISELFKDMLHEEFDAGETHANGTSYKGNVFKLDKCGELEGESDYLSFTHSGMKFEFYRSKNGGDCITVTNGKSITIVPTDSEHKDAQGIFAGPKNLFIQANRLFDMAYSIVNK